MSSDWTDFREILFSCISSNAVNTDTYSVHLCWNRRPKCTQNFTNHMSVIKYLVRLSSEIWFCPYWDEIENDDNFFFYPGIVIWYPRKLGNIQSFIVSPCELLLTVFLKTSSQSGRLLTIVRMSDDPADSMVAVRPLIKVKVMLSQTRCPIGGVDYATDAVLRTPEIQFQKCF